MQRSVAASDLRRLADELHARGLTRKPEWRARWHYAAYLLTSLTGSLLVLTATHVLTAIGGALLMALGGIAVLTAGHTASHHGLSNHRWLNILYTFVSYPLFFQVSAVYWYRKHVVIHHPSPNVVGEDDDADFLPFFATLREQVESSRGLKRRYYRAQAFLIPVMIASAGFNVQIVGWRHLIRTLRGDHRAPRHLIVLDLICLAAHWVVFLLLPLLVFPLQTTFAFYVVRTVVIGMAIFVVAAPAHLPEEAAFIQRGGASLDPFQLQTSVTLNYSTGPIARFFICGSEYQIEHHLFPGLSHLRHAEMSQIVEAFCRERGYPYRTLPWPEAIWKSLRLFWHPKQVQRGLTLTASAPAAGKA